MNLFEAFIAKLAPQTAYKRAQARSLLRAYEAALPSQHRKIARDKRTPNAIVRQAHISLRSQARSLDENHDIAKGILNTLVANIIGKGIQIEPIVKDKDGKLNAKANQFISELWSDWCLSPEVSNELHWSAAERIACRTWLRDGEIFTKLIRGDLNTLNHISKVPFSIELIEADYVPFGLGFPSATAIDGIERDEWGRAKYFWLAKRHNADLIPAMQWDYVKTDAADIIHLKNADRIRQSRGVTILASVITRLADIKDYEESERVAAKIAASMAATIKKGAPDLYDHEKAPEPRSMNFQPGIIFDDLLPGESIEMIDSNRPNINLETFRQGQLRAVASGTSTGYSSISRSYDGTYSAQRQEMVETSVLYGALRNDFIEKFSRPIWRNFIRSALTANLIDTKGLDLTTLENADFRGPGLTWIDPLKEIKAQEAAVRAGFKTKTQIIRELGSNPQEVRNTFQTERELDNELKLLFSSDYANDKNTTSAGNKAKG